MLATLWLIPQKTVTTVSRSNVHSSRAKELTFGKPLICSPDPKEGRGRGRKEKRDVQGEGRHRTGGRETAFTVSKRKAAIPEPLS